MFSESKKFRNTYVSARQKDELRKIIQENIHLNEGMFCNDYMRHSVTWDTVAENLNALGGAYKDAKGWRKTWQDMKRTIKSKVATMVNLKRKTGGGSGDELDNTQLTQDEEQLIPFIGETAISGLEVPETGVGVTYEYIEAIDNFTPSAEVIDLNNKEEQNYAQDGRAITQKFTKADKIIEAGRKKIEIRENFYSKKLKLMEETKALYEREVIAKEKIADSLEKISFSFL